MLDRVAKYHHNHCSVDTSTTNAPIENRRTGDDFLWRNIPPANGIKNLIGFTSLAVESRPAPQIKRVLWALSEFIFFHPDFCN